MKEHAGASRAFLGALRAAPGNKELQRLFRRSILGLRENSQRYVPRWRGMGADKPVFTADDDWSLYKLSPSTKGRGELVNPYDSREDPIVCGALVGANSLISLDDVLDAERNFWQKAGLSVKVDDLRHRVQLVLEDFKYVLNTLFLEYCKRASGLSMLAVSDRKAFVPGNGGALIPVEEHPQEDAPRAPSIGDSDSATRSTSSTSGGDDGNNNSTPDRRFAPINFLGWEEEEVSSRLQRVGGTGATRRPLTVNAMIERFRKQETKQDRDGEAVGTNAQSCDGYDSFVTQRCMTGPQFLDLANDCTLLKGCFGWEAAARVVHRVCRVGRDAKALWSKEIVGDLDVDAEDKQQIGSEFTLSRSSMVKCTPYPPPLPQRLSPPWRGSPGECEGRRENTCSSGNTSTSVSASSTSISTCSNSDDAAGSAVLTVGPTPRAKSRHGHDDKAIDVGEAGDGVSPGVGNYDGGSARQSSTTTSWPRTATPLSKEAAFLLATEDTEGGQGPMIFPEFVEALARLCLERYAPYLRGRPPPRAPSRR